MRPEAIDDVTTKRFQHTKSDASTAAGPGTLKEAKQEPLRAMKRKGDYDLEDGPKKKAKIGPSTASPLRELNVGVSAIPRHRASSLQNPGNVSTAIPTVSTAMKINCW